MNHIHTAFYRGDVYQVDLGRQRGSVESGIRPSIILQNNKGNRFAATLIVVPLTTEIKKINLEDYFKNPEAKNIYGGKPLNSASGKHLEVVKYLVEECHVYVASSDVLTWNTTIKSYLESKLT